ncbi:MAG TPA: hypothetical protein VKB26_15595, partial [Candidatus Acidoferrales bacterium]|nr:hypothetical protein [Candidatus Acidoferrales bacterium]
DADLHRRLAFLRCESLAGFSKHSAPNMTRRGSLAYYLAAWVCGCFFMSATIWLNNVWVPTGRAVSDLLFIYFLYLMNGALPMLLFGFVLRRTTNSMHWRRTWQWIAAGAVLAPALTALLGTMSWWQVFQGSGWRDWISSYLLSSSATFVPPKWMSIVTAPAGAATAWVLSRIDRAFATRPNE